MSTREGRSVIVYVVAALAVATLAGGLVYVAFFLSAAQSAKLASVFEPNRWRVHGATVVGRASAQSLLVVDALRVRGRGGREHVRLRIVSLANGAVAAERVEHANVSDVEVIGSDAEVVWLSGLGAGPSAARVSSLETTLTPEQVRAADPSLAEGPVRVAFDEQRGLVALGRDGRWRAVDARGRATPTDAPATERNEHEGGAATSTWASRAVVPASNRTLTVVGGPGEQHLEGLGEGTGATGRPAFLGAAIAVVRGSALVLRDPESVLVRHGSSLGERSRLRLSRVATDGRALWQLDVVATPAWPSSGDHLVSAFALGQDVVLVVEEREGERAAVHVVRIDCAHGTRRFAARL